MLKLQANGRKHFDKYNETWVNWYLIHSDNVVTPDMDEDEAIELDERVEECLYDQGHNIQTWFGGPGNGYAAYPTLRISPHHILVKQRCGRDV